MQKATERARQTTGEILKNYTQVPKGALQNKDKGTDEIIILPFLGFGQCLGIKNLSTI